MITEEQAIFEIVFLSEVRELTELFKKHKHLHGSKKFADALVAARSKIEIRQSIEVIQKLEATRSSYKIHKLQWKFLPRDEKK